jgi:hypothetical protein
MNTDHIVHNSDTQHMECQHCGFSQAIMMPDTIDSILTQFDAFTAAHETCKRPPAEAVMSEYIKGFDHGCDYIVAEIERYIKQYSDNKFALTELLAHLKMEGKPDIGKVPAK